MRTPTRLLAFGTVEPAAALGARSIIESMRPYPARSGPVATGVTTTALVPDCGTTTAEGCAAGAGCTTTDGAGCTTTGAGAGATWCSVAQPARAAMADRERTKGSLLISDLLL